MIALMASTRNARTTASASQSRIPVTTNAAAISTRAKARECDLVVYPELALRLQLVANDSGENIVRASALVGNEKLHWFVRRGADSSQRAGAESCDDIVAFRRKEIPVARARDARTGSPASSSQYLARVEPRL